MLIISFPLQHQMKEDFLSAEMMMMVFRTHVKRFVCLLFNIFWAQLGRSQTIQSNLFIASKSKKIFVDTNVPNRIHCHYLNGPTDVMIGLID